MRRITTISLSILVLAFSAQQLGASDAAEARARAKAAAKVRAMAMDDAQRKPEDIACEKGLAFLASVQMPDGSFGSAFGNAQHALAAMAFMASGHFPGRGKYGENLERCILSLARRQDVRGYFGLDGARMYGHGMCTLALGEAYGMMSTREKNMVVRDALEKAVNVIINAQSRKKNNNRGGWRYEPTPGDGDLSVTIWQIQALRSAQNCQVKVPQETMDMALDYLKRSFHPSAHGFSYSPGGGPNTPMRFGGHTAMATMKQKQSDEIKKSTAKILELAKDKKLQLDVWGQANYFYRSYYAATTGKMIGEQGMKQVNTPIEKVLLEHQNPDGSWPPAPGMGAGQAACPVYSTAFSCMILGVRYQYLPIYQE